MLTLLSTPIRAHEEDQFSLNWRQAVSAMDLSTLQLLWPQRPDDFSVDYPDTNGRTALMVAAANGDIDFTQTLIKSGANANERSFDGSAVLHFAAASAPVIDLLLSVGAEPNVSNGQGNSVIMRAARVGAIEVVERLLARSVNVTQTNTSGQSIMHLAALGGSVPVVLRLLKTPAADLLDHSDDIYGNSALLLALLEGHDQIAQILVKIGADKDLRNLAGISAAEIMAEWHD